MAQILVAGGMGYIGSHTVVELMHAGYEVVIADNLSNSSISVLEGIYAITGKRAEFENIDLADSSEVDSLFRKFPDICSIIHFAAKKAVGESVRKPLSYYRNNLDSLINLIEKVESGFASGIIFSSSCTVYGQPEKLPVTESTPFKPAESPYGRTKQMAEDILKDVCMANKEVNAIALRYFNPVGAHESGNIGELPNGIPSNLVPFITQTAAGIHKEIKIFGNNYNTSDGTALRDYIHVVDLAKAHVAALNRILYHHQKSNFEYFNVGTGKSISVLQLINAFEYVNNVKVNYTFADRRAGDIEQIYADTTLANLELGWSAKLDINHMMKSAWTWQKKLTKAKL